MDEEYAEDFDCGVKISGGKVVQVEIKGATFTVSNPFHLARLDTILRAFACVDSLGLVPSENGESEKGNFEETSKFRREKEPPQQTEEDRPAVKSPTKGEQIEKAGIKNRMGRPPKYSDEIINCVLALFKKGKKPQDIQKVILEDYGVACNRNMMHKWRRKEKARAELIKKGEKAEEKLETAENEKVEATEKKPKDRYAGYKLVQARDNDLAIVDDKVTCPVEKRAVDVDTTCRDGCDYGAYIALIRHTGTKKPHVRCGRA